MGPRSLVEEPWDGSDPKGGKVVPWLPLNEIESGLSRRWVAWEHRHIEDFLFQCSSNWNRFVALRCSWRYWETQIRQSYPKSCQVSPPISSWVTYLLVPVRDNGWSRASPNILDVVLGDNSDDWRSCFRPQVIHDPSSLMGSSNKQRVIQIVDDGDRGRIGEGVGWQRRYWSLENRSFSCSSLRFRTIQRSREKVLSALYGWGWTIFHHFTTSSASTICQP